MKLTTTDTLTVVEGAKSYHIIASPNALVYDPETGAMDQSSITVEVWHTDSDDGYSTHVTSLSDYDLSLEANAGGATADTGAETKSEVISYEENVSRELHFADLLTEFNAVLTANGKRAVTAAMNVFDYLVEAYSSVVNEYEDENSALFSSSTYPEIYGNRGESMTYGTEAVNAMTSWIMAMCLAEIVPTRGTSSNIQTQLFQKAYELGGGRSVPLYGSFALRGDPMVTRLVAGAVYVRIRSGKSFGSIDVFRDEIGGSSINASNWDGLGYTHTETFYNGVRNGYNMNSLGYLVNTDLFLPSAPGPRISNSKAAGKPLPSAQGQPSSLFNSENNYKVDANINTNLVANYRLSKLLARSTWNGYSAQKKNWLIQTAALSRCTPRYMFCGKINVSLASGGDGAQYVFQVASQETGMAIEGPFSILANKNLYPFISQTDGTAIENAKTAVQKFIDKVLDIADNSRWPTYDTNYGRRRPCSPTSGLASGAYSSTVGHEQNAIYNISLTLMVADNQQQYDKWNAEDQNNHATERPAAYPSGHSSQIWTMAMLLGQMNPENLISFMTGAYRYSYGRAVGRAHWNSDIIYGRLFATMILPIINAMNGSGWQEGYEAMKRAVVGSEQPGGDITVSFVVKNNRSSAVTIRKRINCVLANPDYSGNYYGWEGPYNRYNAVGDGDTTETVTIPAGGSVTWQGSFEESARWPGVRTFAGASAVAYGGYANNILLYNSNGVSEDIVPEMIPTTQQITSGSTFIVNIN